MAVRLNQIVAVEKTAKQNAENEITKAYHAAQRAELFAGMTRTYQPKDDEGEQLPGESQKVQTTVKDVSDRFVGALSNLFDITATKVYANTRAQADVKIGDTVLASNVPVEYLLFLEKRLQDVQTFLAKLPTLSPEFSWTLQDSDGLYHAEPVRSHRTKKVLRNHVKAAATDKHPAQVETYTEDETVGYWTTTRLSGATTATQVAEWRDRVSALQEAVKFAREEANSAEVEQQKVGDSVFGYIFG
jgi:hypothetical protein